MAINLRKSTNAKPLPDYSLAPPPPIISFEKYAVIKNSAYIAILLDASTCCMVRYGIGLEPCIELSSAGIFVGMANPVKGTINEFIQKYKDTRQRIENKLNGII